MSVEIDWRASQLALLFLQPSTTEPSYCIGSLLHRKPLGREGFPFSVGVFRGALFSRAACRASQVREIFWLAPNFVIGKRFVFLQRNLVLV